MIAKLASLRAAPDMQAAEFALKCYVSCLLAYYVALRIGLQNPFWALTTCIITATPVPLAGAIISKAVYRTLGTLLGGIAALILVPWLVNSPAALSFALALWLGLCVSLSLLDRTPRTYVFALAGYTASIIGFPSVLSPDNVFNVAILREQEIVLGIVCAALIHGALFPRTLTEQLRLRIARIRNAAESVSVRSLEGKADPALDVDRRHLALDIGALQGLATQLPYDTARIVPDARIVTAFQHELTLLLPLSSAVQDRIAELSLPPRPVPDTANQLATEIAQWLRLQPGRPGYVDTADSLISATKEAIERPAQGFTWECLLVLNLLPRLQDLVTAHRNMRELGDELNRESFRQTRSPRLDEIIASTPSRSLHRDALSAVLVGASASLTILCGCLFWIATAWPAGPTAVQIAAVGAGLFSSFPRPTAVLKRFTGGVAAGIVVAAFYGYVLLPRVTDPVMLAVVLSPPLLVFSAVAASPTVGLLGLAALIGFLNTAGFAAVYQRDFASFANLSLALLFGTGMATATYSLSQSGTAQLANLRLLKAAYRDVALRASRSTIDTTAWMSRMLDRIALFSTTQSLKNREPGAPVIDVLMDMRTGYLAGALRNLSRDLPAERTVQVAEVSEGIARYYGQLNPRNPAAPPPDLLGAIDRGVHALNQSGNTKERRECLSILVGIRRNLFPSAPPWVAVESLK